MLYFKGGCHYVKTYQNSSACSTWLGSHPPHQPSSELPAAFDQQVREGLIFYMLRKRCPVFGSLTLEPRTTDSLSITSTNISLFPPWINAHKKCMQMLSYLKHALYCCVLYSFWIPDYSAPSYLLSAGLDGSGGCRTRRHFTLLCLSPKLKKDFNFSHWRKSK